MTTFWFDSWLDSNENFQFARLYFVCPTQLWCMCNCDQTKVLPEPQGSTGRRWSPFQLPSARHQPKLQVHGHAASRVGCLFSSQLAPVPIYCLVIVTSVDNVSSRTCVMLTVGLRLSVLDQHYRSSADSRRWLCPPHVSQVRTAAVVNVIELVHVHVPLAHTRLHCHWAGSCPCSTSSL